MTISGRHIQEGDHLIVDGRRVSGTLISQQGAFSDMDIIVELETLPMDGMHFLQIQNPDGMFSNDFIFHVAHEKTDDASSISSQKIQKQHQFSKAASQKITNDAGSNHLQSGR